MDTSNLKPFIAFLDMVANPEKYKTLILDLKAATDEYYKAAGMRKAVEEVQVWQREVEAKFARQESALEEQKQMLVKKAQDLVTAQNDHQATVNKAMARLATLEQAIVAREKAVSGLEDVKHQLALKIESYDKLHAAVSAEQKQLKQREDALRIALK